MKKFIAIYYSTPKSKAIYESLSESDLKAVNESWSSWEAKNQNYIIDLGHPLLPGTPLDQIACMEDPNKFIGGYSIIKAKDLEDAKLLFWGHPYENKGIHIFECIAM